VHPGLDYPKREAKTLTRGRIPWPVEQRHVYAFRKVLEIPCFRALFREKPASTFS
jgi:hypothetical protein